MATLGEHLRNARLERNVTISQAAEDTHIKVQIIEGLEQDDFSGIAAPIYGKGFVRLYAEYLGMDPAPLVAAYLSQQGGQPARMRQPEPLSSVQEDVDHRPAGPGMASRIKDALSGIDWQKVNPFRKRSLAGDFERVYRAFAEQPLESTATLIGVVIVMLFVLSMLSRCVR